MDKYIKQLLLLHSKIILPGFGAIVIEDDETGELMFNEYLTYDDGKLSSLLVEESNMDLQEATNNVAKFVRELKHLLNKGEAYSIFQLGEFRKLEDGTVIFEGNIKSGGKSINDKISGPSTTPSTVPTPTIKEDKPLIEKENKPIPETEEIKAEPKIDKTEKPIKEVTVDSETKLKEKVQEKTKVKKNIYVEKNTNGSKSEGQQEEKIKPQPVVKEKKKKRSPLFWILIVFLFFIISGGAYLIINYEKVEERMGWNLYNDLDNESTEEISSAEEVKIAEYENEEITNEENIIDESDNTNEAVVEALEEETVQTPEPVLKESEPIASSSGEYHIVIGCFGELENAKNQVTKYKQKGFDSKVIGQSGGLHFVAAQSYPNYSAAKADLSRVRETNEGAWLYKK